MVTSSMTTAATTGAGERARSLLLPARFAAPALPIGHAGCLAGFIPMVGLGCAQFLYTYAALHVMHAWGVHLPLVGTISSIPLFSIFVASFAVGAATAIPAAAAYEKVGRRRPPLPIILALAIGAFAVAILLVP
jgi:hypothetical protein